MAVYQGRYKSFICEDSHHLPSVIRYVERNPLRANLVARAEEWRWSSLHVADISSETAKLPLASWPMARPRDWVERVNRPETAGEFEAIRQASVSRKPFGSTEWTDRISALTGWRDPRPRGRPPKPRVPTGDAT